MVKITISVFALMAALASAYTQPDMSVGPSGNPIITPATGSTVDAGKAFDLTWTPTSSGTVTIYLCKGPSSNCQNQVPPLADHVKNSGSFSWSVQTTWPASTTKGEGYGIMIVDDVNPKIYQWSGQFGIANSEVSGSSSASASGSHSASGSGYPASTTSSAPAKSTYASATGGYNSTVIQPSKSMTVPATLKSTASASTTPTGTSSSTPKSTGAAGMVQVGLGAVFGGLVAALAL